MPRTFRGPQRRCRQRLALLLLAAASGCATAPPRAQLAGRPADDGCGLLAAGARARPSAEREALEAMLDRAMASARADGPGVAVLVLRDGQVIAQRQYGLASLEHRVPFTPEHVVRHFYSEGREFVAIAAVLMERDGLLRLDDSVRTFFPQLPAWSAPVRIRDLIHHRSGFVDEWSALLLMHGSMANRFDESQFLRLLADQPSPEIEPRRGYMYSNSDYGLLRLILDKAAGGDLAGYLNRRLFAPLGMHATRLTDDLATIYPNEAQRYEPHGNGFQRHTQVKSSPGGRYVIATTACDLARWANAHFDSTSELSRAVARLMDGATPLPGLEGHFAFGRTFTSVNGVPVERHEGVIGAAYLTRVPSRRLAVVTFGNGYYEPTEHATIVRRLLGAAEDSARPRFSTEPIALDAAALTRYAGRYMTTSIRSWESDTLARQLATVELRNDTLVARFSWGRAALIPVGIGRFAWKGPDFTTLAEFPAVAAGETARMVLSFDDGFPSETYERLPPWTPTRAWLERLEGRYRSPHLDYTWTLSLDASGQLVLRAPTIADLRLEPFQPGEFLVRHEKYPGVTASYWVRFHEDANGEIQQLTVWSPRMMNHRFERVR
jgi:CubicO group peptidase (beta-lactamase class C family)